MHQKRGGGGRSWGRGVGIAGFVIIFWVIFRGSGCCCVLGGRGSMETVGRLRYVFIDDNDDDGNNGNYIDNNIDNVGNIHDYNYNRLLE